MIDKAVRPIHDPKFSKMPVLIADSDRDSAKLLKNILMIIGFKEIYLCHNGRDAISILLNKNIQLMISDWTIPPLDELELIKYVRQSENHVDNSIPIILLTKNATKESVKMARDMGVTEFLIKPYTADALRDRITSAIETPRKFIKSKGFVGPDRRRRMRKPRPKNTTDT